MWRDITRPIAPDEDSVERGTKFLCQIDRKGNGHSGEVRNEQDIVRWRYGIRRNASGRVLSNPFNKPDFVVAEAGTEDELIIRRASFMPPVFNIMRAGRVIGRIRMRSIFRNKYSITIDGVNSWTFRMPLFTIRFYGHSSAGPEVWVVVGPSKMEWIILIKAGVKEWPLVATLAFIHSEWWNYG
jgi:hypothetical protein